MRLERANAQGAECTAGGTVIKVRVIVQQEERKNEEMEGGEDSRGVQPTQQEKER